MIDGEALWRSDKLSKIEPPEFRAEYANLIPLALADGTFEANPRRVWADVYSYNRPDITLEVVEELLDELERVGLLIRRTDDAGKVWGKWTGIESRLPSDSTKDRYKSGNINIFSDIVENDPITIRSRSDHDPVMPGLDRIGLDRIGKELESQTGTFKFIATHYHSFFGITHSHAKKHIEKYQIACQKYGEDKILEKFDQWAQDAEWLRDRRDPNGLNFFWKPLEELINSDILKTERDAVHKVNAGETTEELETRMKAKALDEKTKEDFEWERLRAEAIKQKEWELEHAEEI